METAWLGLVLYTRGQRVWLKLLPLIINRWPNTSVHAAYIFTSQVKCALWPKTHHHPTERVSNPNHDGMGLWLQLVFRAITIYNILESLVCNTYRTAASVSHGLGMLNTYKGMCVLLVVGCYSVLFSHYNRTAHKTPSASYGCHSIASPHLRCETAIIGSL